MPQETFLIPGKTQLSEVKVEYKFLSSKTIKDASEEIYKQMVDGPPKWTVVESPKLKESGIPPYEIEVEDYGEYEMKARVSTDDGLVILTTVSGSDKAMWAAQKTIEIEYHPNDSSYTTMEKITKINNKILKILKEIE